MQTAKMLRLTASAFVIGAGFVAGAPATSDDSVTTSAKSSRGTEAATAAAKAQAAISAHKVNDAVEWAERAVAGDPQNAGYRLILGEAYLAAGRFISADTTFSDVLALDPGNAKAGFKLALTRIATGRPTEARSILEQHKAGIPAADYGLALAISGDTEGAVRVLEPLARAHNATAKARQNLALSYALSGRWLDARAVAAQDLPMSTVDRRIAEWASFARPTAAWDQVASLLGITPAYDAGQPTVLALANASGPVQVALAPPVAEPVATPAAVEPVVAEVVPAEPASDIKSAAFEVPLPSAQNAPVEAPAAPVAAPAAVIAPAPVAPVIKAAPKPAVKPVAARIVQPKKAPLIVASRKPVKQMLVQTKTPTAKSATTYTAKPAMRSGQFAVQLGAYTTSSKANRAWTVSKGRNASLLSGRAPATSTIKINGNTLYRLAVNGFATRADANRVCTRVRASGGTCFVRAITKDTSVRLMKRGNGTKLTGKRTAR